MRSIAIVGGGILGVTTALLAARRGWEVELFEAAPSLWSGASATNEGKVHLGTVFALGTESTHQVMIDGAMAFSRVLDEAVGHPLVWADLVTDVFDYSVMPDSLIAPDELSRRYEAMNRLFDRQQGSTRYLDETIDSLVDPAYREDPVTGLATFTTSERAVDPLRLGALLVEALLNAGSVALRTATPVTGLRPYGKSVEVAFTPANGKASTSTFDYVVNCAWDQQIALLPTAQHVERNYRLKTAVRLAPQPAGRPVTLVQGPYGDVVGHRDYTYVSWYPSGRLSNEFAVKPSDRTYGLLSGLAGRPDLVRSQLEPLRELGLLPAAASSGELVGGLIVGHGALDIDSAESSLHNRSEFGVLRFGRIIVPTNFKFSTAPLAAWQAVEDLDAA